MYGGHITDPWDRRTNNVYLKVLLQPGIFENEEMVPCRKGENDSNGSQLPILFPCERFRAAFRCFFFGSYCPVDPASFVEMNLTGGLESFAKQNA